MIARQQHLRHGVPAVDRRPRIARRAELAIEKGIAVRALVVGHRAGEKTHCRVNDRERGWLTAAEHEVTERDFFGRQMIGDALIHILVVATEKRQLLSGGVTDGVGLREAAATRREQHDRSDGAKRLDGLEEWIWLHDHSRAAPVRVIVDGAVAIVGVITQVDDLVRDAPGRGGWERRVRDRRLA